MNANIDVTAAHPIPIDLDWQRNKCTESESKVMFERLAVLLLTKTINQ